MTTFETYLEGLKGTLDDGLIQLLANVAKATRQISDTLRTSSLTGLSGATETINVQGETQKPLDILSNDLMLDACKASAAVSFAVSEELDSEVPVHADGAYAVIFDPLDGSSNLDVNVTVGTIFSVIPARPPRTSCRAAGHRSSRAMQPMARRPVSSSPLARVFRSSRSMTAAPIS